MITLYSLTEFFGWCTIINILVLALTTLMLVANRGFVVKTHKKMFGLSEVDLTKAYFNYLALFKIAVIVFNLVPYLALKIIG